MTTAQEIGWGKYGGYEGPFFRGKLKFSLPANPDFLDKALYVITSTEGGAYDAINMYDRCIISVGLIQFCERVFNFSEILGACAERDLLMLETKLSSFPSKVEFEKNKYGKWRWFDMGAEVTSEAMQRAIFLGGAAIGKEGTWGPVGSAARIYAKDVAAWAANLWDYPLFRVVQNEATKKKLMSFVLPEARELIFQNDHPDSSFSWRGALKAMYMSFAANLPSVANKSIQKAAARPEWATADWADRFRLAAQVLTFGPGIDIYPHRYEAISKVLEKVFDIAVPNTAAELKTWDDAPPEELRVEVSEEQKQIAARWLKLSDDLVHGRGEGLDVLENLDGDETGTAAGDDPVPGGRTS